jgi:hypothetical protein
MIVKPSRVMLVMLSLAGGLVACGGADPAARLRVAERDRLRREVAGFKGLEALTNAGLVDRDRGVVVAVSDSLLGELVDAALPVTVTLPGDVTVRLTKASVVFRANVARVGITGALSRASFPRVAALITLDGALDAFAVDSARTLRARVTIDDVAVDAPSGVPGALGPLARSVLQSIVERSLPELSAQLPAVALPVRLDREIRLPAFGPDGVLSIGAVSAPLTVSAHNVVAFNDRLWISLRVEHGAFTPVESKPDASKPDAGSSDARAKP